MNTHHWYFAYGSNLDRHTFLDRRGMQPRNRRMCQLEGYRLCFDLPVGPGERGVANLAAAPRDRVWGMAFELLDSDCRRLDRSEGVDFGAYQRQTVQLTDVSGEKLQAFTYISEHRDPHRKPSPRYIGLLLRGAREHCLPDDYQRFLERHDLAVDEREPPAVR